VSEAHLLGNNPSTGKKHKPTIKVNPIPQHINFEEKDKT
jgi:hypothetical protein